jgi:carbonic anhydrase
MSTTRSHRRDFLLASLATGGLAALGSRVYAAETQKPLSADDVLADLLGGNARFVAGKPENPRRSPADYSQLAKVQNPEAVIVGCADSRVPPEVLFDQGVGDLFVVRIAGNVINHAGATVKGSIEYAIAELKTPLVVVLGHSDCGAIKAAIKYAHGGDAPPGAIGELVDIIAPAVTEADKQDDEANEQDRAIIANVRRGVATLKRLDPIISPRVKTSEVKVVGAVYDLATGKVKLIS